MAAQDTSGAGRIRFTAGGRGCSGGCGGSRSGNALVALGPLRFSLDMVGPMETELLDRTRDGAPIESATGLGPDSELELRWRDGRFLGRHWLLGDVHAEMRSTTSAREPGEDPSGGVVQPIGRRDPSRASGGFFPAHNENRLWFTFRFPRLRLAFEHEEPVRNAAEITQIPPYGTPFPLREPGWLRELRWRWLKLRIAACVVRTMAEEHLQADVVDIRRVAPDVVDVDVDVSNRSPVGTVQVVWGLSAVQGDARINEVGRVTLRGRKPRRVTVRLQGRALTGDCEVCFRVGVVAPRQLGGAASAGVVATL